MSFPLIAVFVAVLACLVVGRTAGTAVRRLRPMQAVRLLTAASLAVSLATGIALTAIAVAVIASLGSVAAEGHWSAAVIRAEVPVPAWLGAGAAVMVAVLLVRAAIRTVSIVLSLVRAEKLCRSLRTGNGPMVVLGDGSADAFTIAGLHGCVVIGQRLLDELDADERRVLTAHELSHLTRRHHLYVHIADIAAAANPLLRNVSAAVRLGVERWADEDAAAGMGDRRVTGRALARVALLRSALARSSSGRGPTDLAARIPVLGVGALQVASRVQALLEPAPARRNGRVATAVVLSILVLLVGIASLAHIREAIESAAPYLHHFRQR
ncbi:Zn-dependent protease with chaperone function [Nakamurella sp. UYEF19]|uniref:M48 family metalloprotease n=1 Tax=Nakamurella sp. UYEF19 TaxID=1756392 RepID=UPI00339ADD16